MDVGTIGFYSGKWDELEKPGVGSIGRLQAGENVMIKIGRGSLRCSIQFHRCHNDNKGLLGLRYPTA
jgi:hypothetical protein